MARFRLGDHEFIEPGTPAPIERLAVQNRRPIRGAIPPTWLRGIAVDADPAGPSRFLVDGMFCGHGDPTFAMFDLVIDGARELEVAVVEENRMRRVLARPPGRDVWTVLQDLRWFPCESGEALHPDAPITAAEQGAAPFAMADGSPARIRVSIGIEYPADCASENDVSWVAFATEPVGNLKGGIFLDEETRFM